MARQGTVCPHRGQARPGMTRFGEPRKPCPLPAACPHSWLQGAVGAGPRKPASAPPPRPTCLHLSWSPPGRAWPILPGYSLCGEPPSSETLPLGLSASHRACPYARGPWSLPELSAPGTELAACLPPHSGHWLHFPSRLPAQKGHTECEGRPQSGHLSSGPCPGCRAAPALCLALYPHTLPWP